MKNFIFDKKAIPVFILGLQWILFSNSCYAADEWLADEVLKQLQEISRDVKSMKQEIKQLRAEVAELKTAAAGKRGAVVSRVKLGGNSRMGSKDAKLAIVEFSDFQCPFCARHNAKTLPQIKKTYIDSGKLQYVMRNFPLGFHKHARSAAIAAACAGNQGKFWEMHDALFSQQQNLKSELYISQAEKLGLKQKAFRDCLKNPSEAKKIDADLNYGEQIGVSGTPAFFVGRIQGDEIVDVKMISGAQSFSGFQRTIDAMLKAIEKK